MSFASVCIIVACLIIMGSFGLLAYNVNKIIDTFEDENIIIAYVDENLSEAEAKQLRSQIEGLDNVSSAEFISRDSAMSDFVSKYDKSLFEDLDSTVLRHRYSVYLDDISLVEQTQNDLKSVQGIAEVSAHLDIAKAFVTLRNVVSGIFIVLAAILLVVSLFIMSNTIKLGTFERREEIAIMKMVGATNRFIRWPFVLEGFILGITGSLIAFVAQWGIYKLINEKIVGANRISLISVVPFSSVALPVLIVFLAIGFCIGVGGSSLAIKNYLKV